MSFVAEELPLVCQLSGCRGNIISNAVAGAPIGIERSDAAQGKDVSV